MNKLVMRRVYFIWLIRMVFYSLIIKLVLLILMLWQMLGYISPSHIFQNAKRIGTWSGDYRFFLDSFNHTELIVKTLGLVSGLLAFWLAKDIFVRVKSGARPGLFSRSRFWFSDFRGGRCVKNHSPGQVLFLHRWFYLLCLSAGKNRRCRF